KEYVADEDLWPRWMEHVLRNDTALCEWLWERVRESKRNSDNKDEDGALVQVAINAITLLAQYAHVNFSGKDLRGIRIPGADLSYTLCDSTLFENADLSAAQFTGAWLRNSSLKGAKLSQLRFREWPFIKAEGEVHCCVFSPDNRWLAVAAGMDIEIYAADTRRLHQRLCGHTNIVMSVAFDAKGERLASGGRDETVRLWETSTGKELCCLRGHTDWVQSVAFDAKGEWLASGSRDETVRLWEIDTGKELCCLRGHTNWVQSVVFDAKDERLASGS